MSNISLWQPAVGTTWNYYLPNPVDLLDFAQAPDYEVWDIDLFLNNASTISAIRGNNLTHVICYFSAGSYEDWRPDASNFTKSDLGDDLQGWPGEKWLNISSPNVRSIMTRRLDLAVTKGCNGVDPDNIDGYSNENGLGLTQQDSIDYMNFLADETEKRKLSIGLKNSNAIVSNLVDRMQWSINEECHHYDECQDFMPFIQKGKPVFNVEYPKGDKTNNNDAVTTQQLQSACNNTDTPGISTIVKNINLNWFTESCDGEIVTQPANSSSSSGDGDTDGGTSSSSSSGNGAVRTGSGVGYLTGLVVCFSILLVGYCA